MNKSRLSSECSKGRMFAGPLQLSFTYLHSFRALYCIKMDIDEVNQCKISYLLPCAELKGDNEEIDLEELNCSLLVKTVNIHSTEPNPNFIEVVTDNALVSNTDGKQVVEVMGSSSKMVFSQTSSHQYLVFHLKPINKFFKLSFILHDLQGNQKTVELANSRSVIAADNKMAQLPLTTSSMNSWQRLCLDLHNIMYNAFGIQADHYSHCSNVTIWGSCRLGKVFFQSRDYADPELPACLRVMSRPKKS
jgi:hypothetical protein